MPRSRRRRPSGPAIRGFPKTSRWKVDQDYWNKLSQSEREYLAEFNDRFYIGDFREDREKEWTTEQRREVYRAKNAANADMSEYLRITGALFYSGGVDYDRRTADGEDTSPAPAYLNSPEYKEALAAFRKTNVRGPGRSDRIDRDSPTAVKAARVLERIVRSGEVDEYE